MKEKFESLKNNITQFADGIKNGFKSALNIHSPSKWMRDEIGKNIVLGIEEGFTRNLSNTLGTMQGSLLGDLSGLQVGGTGNNVNITINPQHLDANELDSILAYVNRRFGMQF